MENIIKITLRGEKERGVKTPVKEWVRPEAG